MASGFLFVPPQQDIGLFCTWIVQNPDFSRILPGTGTVGPMVLPLSQLYSAQQEHKRQTVPTGEPKLTQTEVEVVTAQFPWANLSDQVVVKSSPKGESIWEGKAMYIVRCTFVRWEVHLIKNTKCQKRIGASWEYFLYKSNLRYYSWAVQALEVLVNLMAGWVFTLASFSLPRITVIFGGENEEQHWL